MDSFRGDEFVQDVLYVPVERNKESGDFVCNNWIFQATLKASHDIKAHGIVKLSEQFNDCKTWNFCFCVPKTSLTKYKYKQRILNPELLAQKNIKIDQYIVAIE